MKRISILSLIVFFSILCSLATSLELKASTNGASTHVVFGAGVNDFAKEKIKLSEMRSVFEESNDTDEEAESWLPCCNDGWNGMVGLDQKVSGTTAQGVFDCTCATKA